MRRIDAHHHVWDLDVRDQPWTADLAVLRQSFDFAELRPLLAAHDIDATVVVQTICVPEETPELLTLAAGEAGIAGVVGWVDLTAPSAAASIAELQGLSGGSALAGIRHQVQEEADPRWLCRADVRRGLTELATAALAYDLLIVPEQFPAAIETVAALPEVRFVLDHGGKPAIAAGELEPWRSDIAALAALPNVAVKASGLVTEARPDWTAAELRPYVDVLLESFGPRRMMFGSDWPVCLLAATYDQVVAALSELLDELSDTERAEIFGGTAERWYGLGS